MSKIIGLNAFHADAAACLVIDGKLRSAAEEERFLRIKHWAGFPVESIKFCLSENGLSLSDIDYIAVNSDPSKNLTKKIRYGVKNLPDISFLVDRIKASALKNDIGKHVSRNLGAGFKGQIVHIEHHQCHLASGHIASPFQDSVSVSIDGLGDFVSTAWGVGKKNTVNMDGKIYFPHSLGIYYEALTHYLGFKNYGDEYKVMGLAPYGKDSYVGKLRELILLKDDGLFELNLDYFTHHKGKVQHTWDGGIPITDDSFSQKIEELLGPERKPREELTQHHMDIAYAIQKVYEEAFFHLLLFLHDKYQIDNLSISGGCGNNSVANGKIYRNTPFKKAYVAASSGDAGGAIGSAFELSSRLDEIDDNLAMHHAYWGPSFKTDFIQELLSKRSEDLNPDEFKINSSLKEDDLIAFTAKEISKGNVIGWFQGGMEWGPRALGNRSILGDPRRNDMKDILNLKIKRRESFRPFAPSILKEEVKNWFEEDDDVPFMMKVFQIKEEKRELIPAVTHVDGSGRLQTVDQSNSRYYKLIKAFKAISNVPILLNTSFNENEPVVCTPEEALNCFLRTKMDVLVLGDTLIMRK